MRAMGPSGFLCFPNRSNTRRDRTEDANLSMDVGRNWQGEPRSDARAHTQFPRPRFPQSFRSIGDSMRCANGMLRDGRSTCLKHGDHTRPLEDIGLLPRVRPSRDDGGHDPVPGYGFAHARYHRARDAGATSKTMDWIGPDSLGTRQPIVRSAPTRESPLRSGEVATRVRHRDRWQPANPPVRGSSALHRDRPELAIVLRGTCKNHRYPGDAVATMHRSRAPSRFLYCPQDFLN
jgi:hypothetical protein